MLLMGYELWVLGMGIGYGELGPLQENWSFDMFYDVSFSWTCPVSL